jgi:hypothetical protein
MRIRRRGCSNGDTRRVGRVTVTVTVTVTVGLVRRDVAALSRLMGTRRRMSSTSHAW